MLKLLLSFFLFIFTLFFPTHTLATDIPQLGVVTQTPTNHTLKVKLSDDREVIVTHTYADQPTSVIPQVGDKVFVAPNQSPDENQVNYVMTDFSRTQPLIILATIFFLITLITTHWWGLKSFLGMFFSFYLIFKLLLPQIMAGQDPVLVTIITALFIIPITFYLSHGINRKTNSAIFGTLIALIFTGLLATLFVNLTHLTGLASEEAGFLLAFMGDKINIRGLLLAGIILGTLGVIDDVTVSQSAIVTELYQANPKLDFSQLYRKAMRVGHDHISSMVNTLVLVYAGASLPLLLLFLDSSRPLNIVFSSPIIAEEIVRTLVGSIGLVLAVPLTTLITAYQITHSR